MTTDTQLIPAAVLDEAEAILDAERMRLDQDWSHGSGSWPDSSPNTRARVLRGARSTRRRAAGPPRPPPEGRSVMPHRRDLRPRRCGPRSVPLRRPHLSQQSKDVRQQRR